MNRVATVITSIRPIKKLFLIKENDIDQIYKIIKNISDEVTGLLNIILSGDDNLFSENIKRFVDRHDPDVVINYSSLKDDVISNAFKIPVFSGEKVDSIVNEFHIPFYTVNNLPYPLKLEKITEDVTYSYFDNSPNELSPFDILRMLHFGIADKNYQEKIKESPFESTIIKQIDSLEHFSQLLNFRETSFLYNLLDLAGIGEGSSVWHLDFNTEDLFKDKPTVIVGNSRETKSVIYFWNMRATYPYNRTVWFPVELIEGNEQFIKNFQYCCNFTKSNEVSQLLEDSKLKEIESSQYYFGTYHREWEIFENIENISVIDGKIRVQHPFNKLFSREGINVNFILRINNLTELHLPKSLDAGKLFTKLPDSGIFSHYFARVHKLGLSIYRSQFEPFRQSPVVEELSLPTKETLFHAIFKEHGLALKETSSTGSANEAINLFRGLEGLEILANKEIFNLIVRLAPKRSKRLMEILRAQIQISDQETQKLEGYINNNITSFTSINSETIISTEDILSTLSIRPTDRNLIYPQIQELYERHILLRGKSFACPYCKSKLWYPLEDIHEENKCYGCNRQIQIPIFSGDHILSDHFKLNKLISMAVDQGLLPLMLTTYYLSRQQFYTKRFLYDYEIYSQASNNRLAEIDIVFTMGGKLGLAEVKADRGFSNEQVDRLLAVSEKAGADLLVFSTLKNRETEEVKNLVDYLQNKNLRIPAFIITEEVLFNKKLVDIAPYFETTWSKNEFASGPILMANTLKQQ